MVLWPESECRMRMICFGSTAIDTGSLPRAVNHGGDRAASVADGGLRSCPALSAAGLLR